MTNSPSSYELRAKIIGALIRDARLRKEKSVDECALIIGVSSDQFLKFELGEIAPSMPEIEGLAYYLETPLEQFWGHQDNLHKEDQKKQLDMERLIKLRQRMIGALIRQARVESNLSIVDLAENTSLSARVLNSYELGAKPIPLPELEVICGALHRSIREFQDLHSPIGVWDAQQHAVQDFLELPLDIQLFISKPTNRPYVDVAVRLSEMSVERLRAVAEGLLEITF